MSQRALVSTLVEVAGMVAVVVGAALLSVPVAIMVAGLGMTLIGFSLGNGEKR